MKIRLLFTNLLLVLFVWSAPTVTRAQSGGRRGQSTWYTVHNDVLVMRSGSASKVLTGDVTLPNGSRLEPASRAVVLASGTREILHQDDMVLASGEIIRINAPAAGTAPAPAVASALRAFVPAAPVNGKLRGVVELGASGFNSFIIRMDAQRNWKLEKSEFGNSLVMENMATDFDVSRGLKAYIGKMLDYGVGSRDIHFVVSSGAAMAKITQPLVKSLKTLGYVVHVVSTTEEATLGLRATLPQPYAGRAFLVDMGSANTKIGWLEQGVPTVVSSYGSKYFQQATADAAVAADVASKAAQVPAALRGTCFIIGGVPYELAKAVRQGQEPYTVLRPADGYPQLEGAKVKAGLNIYRALTAATGCQEFIFSWDANFTIGYLLSLN